MSRRISKLRAPAGCAPLLRRPSSLPIKLLPTGDVVEINPALRIAFFRSDQTVSDFFITFGVVKNQRGTIRGFVARYFRNVNSRDFADSLSQLHDARFHQTLPVEGRMVFSVFAQIAKLKRALDFLWEMNAKLGFELVKFSLEFGFDVC